MSEPEIPQQQPQEALVTLPLSQVASWLARLTDLEEGLAILARGASLPTTETAVGIGELVVTSEQQPPAADHIDEIMAAIKSNKEDRASEELTHAFLGRTLRPYGERIISAFIDRLPTDEAPFSVLPPMPDYANVEAWGKYVKRYGRTIKWNEDTAYGTRNLTATYLPDHLPEHRELLRFSISTNTAPPQNQHSSRIEFVFDHGNIVNVRRQQKNTHNPQSFRKRHITSSVFELVLEPSMILHTTGDSEYQRNPVVHILPFQEHKGGFKGPSFESLWAVALGPRRMSGMLEKVLADLPERYRPIA